jgi:hypothetical protein
MEMMRVTTFNHDRLRGSRSQQLRSDTVSFVTFAPKNAEDRTRCEKDYVWQTMVIQVYLRIEMFCGARV